MKVIGLSWFANRSLRSELSAQKAANMTLSKALKREKDRANQLTVTLKTRKNKTTALRKQIRIADENAQFERDAFALDVLHDSRLQTEVFTRMANRRLGEPVNDLTSR